jgi:hypothetical protein
MGGKPKGQRPLGRLIHRLEDNIKMHFKEIEWVGVELIYLAQVRDNWRAVVNLRVPQNAGNFFNS